MDSICKLDNFFFNRLINLEREREREREKQRNSEAIQVGLVKYFLFKLLAIWHRPGEGISCSKVYRTAIATE